MRITSTKEKKKKKNRSFLIYIVKETAISFSLIPTSRFQCQINKDQNQIKTLLKSVNLSFLFLLFIGIHKESPSFTSLWSVFNVCSILVQS
jgi:hypothetical protein